MQEKIILTNLPLFGPVLGEYVEKDGHEYEIKNLVILSPDMTTPGKVNLTRFSDVFTGFSSFITTSPYIVIQPDNGLYKSYMSTITGIAIANKIPDPPKGSLITP